LREEQIIPAHRLSQYWSPLRTGTLEQLLGNCDEMRRLWSGDKDREA
jgi:hypothetical protein